MMKIYLFLFILVFYFIVFLLRSYWLWKDTGINPITFDTTDDAHGFNGRLFKFIAVLEVLIVGVYAFAGDYYLYLLPFWYLEYAWLRILALGLLCSSLIWIITAQTQMADSWRIGIDYEHKTQLVRKGLFSISRNPIFLGVIVANWGLFFLIPNAFTLLVTIWSYSVIQTQVRLEESFLKQVHGDDYENYRKEVKRWLF